MGILADPSCNARTWRAGPQLRVAAPARSAHSASPSTPISTRRAPAVPPCGAGHHVPGGPYMPQSCQRRVLMPARSIRVCAVISRLAVRANCGPPLCWTTASVRLSSAAPPRSSSLAWHDLLSATGADRQRLSVREPHLRLGTGDGGRAGRLLLAFDAKRRLWFSGSRRFVAFSTLLATEPRAGIGGLAEPCGWWGSGLLCGFVDIYANRRFGEPGLAQTIAASLSCEARARRRSFRLEGRRRRRAGCALRRVDVYWGSSCL